MTEPRVSVVIPAYKAAGTIERAVSSVLAQTLAPAEVLIVDDGSPDNTAAVVDVFGDRVRLLRKPNGGAASARNAGIDATTGEWVAFLDADDFWHADKLRQQMAVAAAHPDVGVVGGRWLEQPLSGPAKVFGVQDEGLFGRPLRARGRDAFGLAKCMWTGTLMARRDVIGDDRFVSGLEPAEDRDLWVRLVSRTTTYLLPEPLATYVETTGSMCRTNVDRDCRNMLRVIRRHADLLGSDGARREETELFRKWAAGHLGAGDGAAAIRPAARRLGREPASAEAWWVLGKAAAICLARGRRRAAVV